MSDWIRELARLLHSHRRHGPARHEPPPKRPRRRGRSGGSEPVPADPKPSPTLLTGGAEVPLDEG